MSHHDDDNCNFSNNESFQEVLARGTRTPLTRRNVIRGGVGLVALSSLPFLTACGGGGDDAAPTPGTPADRALGFGSIDKSLLDDVILPAGYSYRVVHATGDRLVSSIPAYSNTGTETDEWTMRVGDHHDGMDLYYVNGSGQYSATETSRALLVMNHESSADAHFFHPNGQTSNGVSGKKYSQFSSTGGWDLGTRLESEVIKEINHHGVSVVEIAKSVGGQWEYKIDSLYNRRVNGQSSMRIAGPAADLNDIRSFMVTKHDTSGTTSRGTLNNCGHGKTPWGTYLACEENWATYFFMPSTAATLATGSKIFESRRRYGVINAPFTGSGIGNQGAPGQGWSSVASAAADDRFGRWDVSVSGATAAQDFRNEPNTFGYNVEIDPLVSGTPVKRVSMGRFAHEAAVCSRPVVGQPLAFYMGCDSRNEYIYKFVSTAVWSEVDVGGGTAAGDKYLNEGKLYVAKFNDTGAGEWLELNIANPLISGFSSYDFANQADVLINARLAADAVGATKMDRPEWGAVNPVNGDIYFTMTNSNAASRPVGGTNAANPRAYAGGNPNGHIVRFKETAGASTATTFQWDIFLFGAQENADANVNLSGLTAKNDFSSPDGLWFSKATGICWIQTDDSAYTNVTNCMLLAAIPGSVGDGGAATVNNTVGVANGTQNTFIGAALGEAKLRRFMVAPKGAEVTGITETADGRAIFVNIQHPGEGTPARGAGPFAFQSQWPGNAGNGAAYGPAGRPRSATIVITRDDGLVIGL